PGMVKAGIELARALKLTGLDERLADLARRKTEPEESRRLCMEAVVAIDPARPAGLLREVLTDSSESFGLREHAANQLGNIRRPEAVEALAAGLQVAPLRLGRRIAAAMSRSPEGGERLLAEVESGKAAPRLLKEREAEGRLSRSQAPGVRDRLKKLIEGLQDLDEGVEKLIGARREGFARAKPDLERGAAVFDKSCGSCHKLGDKGKKLGPELAGIGSRGLDRLLEDLLDPSRNVDKAFAATVVITRQNLIHTGLFLSDEGEVVVLADAEGREVPIPKREVKSREVTPLSPMPSNVGETIPEADFHHLMGYLLSQRAAR
ncbi:MAG: c-type cytochrome, partial [Thermoanaerobaculia bacterium]